jgi:hypothetical protein
LKKKAVRRVPQTLLDGWRARISWGEKAALAWCLNSSDLDFGLGVSVSVSVSVWSPLLQALRASARGAQGLENDDFSPFVLAQALNSL